MDPSTIDKEVAVPKVIPIKTTLGQMFKLARAKVDKNRREKKLVQDIQWDAARRIRRY